MDRYTDDQLAHMAKEVITALNSEVHLYHEHSKVLITILGNMFKLTGDEVIAKLREYFEDE